MAKGKTKTGVPNKHLHARISYLQQAATYLALQGQQPISQLHERPITINHSTSDEKQPSLLQEATDSVAIPAGNDSRQGVSAFRPSKVAEQPVTPIMSPSAFTMPSSGGLSTHLASNLRQVAQKSTIRLHPKIKHTICRACSAVLIAGTTCRKYMENLSRNGSKPHADVLILECVACGAKKRFPVGASKQRRKALREPAKKQSKLLGTKDDGEAATDVPDG